MQVQLKQLENINKLTNIFFFTIQLHPRAEKTATMKSVRVAVP